METTVEIADYLIEKLTAYGVKHIFGVPGDYVLGFFKKLSQSSLQVINTSDEQGAGFAADAYARMNGLGVVCVTYGVGGLKLANTTAEAFAEKSPVLVITGAPGVNERLKNPMLHHKANQFDTQKKIFEQITVASADLSDPGIALQEIDRVLAAIFSEKRPGFIELPRDMVSVKVPRMPARILKEKQSDPISLNEVLQEAISRIEAARRPVILVGAEIQRFGLKEQVIQLAEKTNIPMAVTILSKSAIPETHPLYLGVYAGALGDDTVRRYIEESDCLILLGVLLTDLDLGVFTAHLEQNKTMYATKDRITIAHHFYEDVTMQDFLLGLVNSEVHPCHFDWVKQEPLANHAKPVPGDRKITIERLFQLINNFLDCNTVVISDVGDALFGAIDLVTCRAAYFLSTAYYTSLGFAVPASIAVQLADPNLRPLVLVGDGAFQMTGMELSTAVRYHLNPIVVVLNNYGYATERPILDGPFNDVQPWQFSLIPEIIGGGKGFIVETEEQLQTALDSARAYTAGFSILDVRLAPDDISPALLQLGQELSKRA